MDDVTVDRATLKALGADSRISILKQLSSRRMTQAELAAAIGVSAPAVSEHLEQLQHAGLVTQVDSEGRKWKYYQNTAKGHAIVKPSQTRIFFLLGISVLAFVYSAYSLYGSLNQPVVNGINMQAEVAAPVFAQAMANGAGSAQTTVTTLASQGVPTLLASIPTTEAWLLLASLFVAGVCLGVLIKHD